MLFAFVAPCNEIFRVFYEDMNNKTTYVAEMKTD